MLRTLALVTFLAAIAGCSRGVPPRPGTQPKHLLIVTVGGLRPDHLSAYLYLRPTSAWQLEGQLVAAGQNVAIDDLAEQGVLFAWAFAPSPDPADSLRSLQTGVAPLVAKKRADLPTLAEDLARAGFTTAAFVDGSKLPQEPALERGFKTFVRAEGDAAAIEAARAQLAGGLDKAEHLFVWLHLSGPQPPWDAGPLSPRQGEEPGPIDYANLFVDPQYHGAAAGTLEYLRDVESGAVQLTRADRDHLVDLYDGEVARVAGLLRGFVLFWRNVDGGKSFWNDTLFVLAGTDGEELFDRAVPKPRGPWLGIERVRVPLLLRHPGSLTGSRVQAELVELADVAPTLREWFLGPGKLPPAGDLDGRTLLPVLDSYVRRPFPDRPAISLDLERRQASLRTSKWSLLASAPAGSKDFGYQLYDREHDPLEQEDLAAKYPAKVEELSALLRERIAAYEHTP